MPYPVHALKMGDVFCRHILNIGYFVYHVSFHSRGKPSIHKYWIEAGSLHTSEYTKSLYVKVRYLTKEGKPESWNVERRVMRDMNVEINRYNDHVLFLDWHWAVEYLTRCLLVSLSGGGLAGQAQARECQPEDGQEYHINGWHFPDKYPKPPHATTRTESVRLGDILADAMKRHDLKQRYDFGARWGIKG